jgi:hypothetical protein
MKERQRYWMKGAVYTPEILGLPQNPGFFAPSKWELGNPILAASRVHSPVPSPRPLYISIYVFWNFGYKT